MSIVALIGLLGCISPNIQVGSPNSETGESDTDETADTGDIVDTDTEETDTQDTDTEDTQDSDTDDTAVEDLDGDGVSAGEDCDDNDATVSSSCVPQTGLFAEYLLNEGVGQVLNDNSGNLYSGFIGDSTGTDSYDASWSNGFLSTSSSACATIENINFTQAGPYTIHVAVRSASNQTHSTPRMISFRGTDTAGSNVNIQYSTYGSQLTIDRHDNYSSQTSLNPLDGDWHLVSYVENGSAYSVYVDGVLDFSSTINNPFTWGTMQQVILGGARCGNDHFDGDFAYLSLYDVAQSPAEIFETYTDIRDTLMIQGVTLPGDIDADGDGYYFFEDCDDNDPNVGPICNLCLDGEIETYNGETYIFCPYAQIMTDAFQSCVDMGATPVKIEDDSENSWLYNTALTKPVYGSYNNGDHRTIGLTRVNSFPNWEWYDGTPIGSYFPASTGYSSSDSHRSCSMMIINATDPAALEGEWSGKVCSESYAYVCEM